MRLRYYIRDGILVQDFGNGSEDDILVDFSSRKFGTVAGRVDHLQEHVVEKESNNLAKLRY